jgi:RNA polymerase sigma-70 factor (ECF subfamily)
MNADVPGPDLAEAVLLGRVAQGDARAFDELYTRWSPMLYGLLCKILDDPREAEDALQEGFLHIWGKAGAYDARRSSPTTWAYMVFRNKAVPAADPEGGAEFNERRQAVKAALDEIPPDQREAIRLAFFTGLTQTEIAERLGAPLGTIKARIRRGLLKLGDTLKGRL